MLQFADIARPVVVEQGIEEFGGGFDARESGALPGVDEMADEGRDVLFAFAEGGQADGEDVEAVEEVLAETAGGNFGLEVAVGGGDDAEVDLFPLEGADGAEFPLLNEAEEFDLHLERQVADFVEEGGAAIGKFDETAFVLGGAAEGSLDVTEELAFHQGADQGAAIDGNEGSTGIGIVDGARDHFFPRAAFA